MLSFRSLTATRSLFRSTTPLRSSATRLTSPRTFNMSTDAAATAAPAGYAAPEKTSIASVSFLDAIVGRRTVYALDKTSPISNERIIELVNTVIKHAPSSFNSQSTRVVVALGAHHDKVWDFAKTAIKAVVPAEAYPASEQRLNGFQAAYGTVLFFEDESVVKGLQDALPLYAQKFPVWSEQTAGIHQVLLWTALEAEGLGANLQHYNPLIDEAVAKEFDIPSNWTLNAQLVFGAPKAPAGDKEFKPLEERVKVFSN